jgi:hypothetical protein
MHPDDIERARAEYRRFHEKKLSNPGAVRERRGPTHDYNCHGLTFLCRRAWFDEEQDALGMVLADDGYVEVKEHEVQPGDIVVYRGINRKIEHTGIVVWMEKKPDRFDIWIVSKWSMYGEYVHTVDNSPYAGRPHYMREGQHEHP